ncbi:MAG: hypothetical protein KAR21_14685 [Spirochaetales bacterium]|nr:hypothetical protein [Spirochaetales bacterium]
MKNIFLVFIVLVLTVTPIFTQTSVGVKIALSDYSWRGDDWEDFAEFYTFNNEFSVGFGFGVFSEILLSKQFALQPEVIFTSAKHKYGDGSYWIEETWPLLEMLLYAKFMVPVEGGRIYVMAGPDIFLFRKEIELEDDYGSTAIATAYNDILYGLAINIGYEIDMISGVLLLGLKYTNEFTQYVYEADIYSEGFGLEFGYKFGSSTFKRSSKPRSKLK